MKINTCPARLGAQSTDLIKYTKFDCEIIHRFNIFIILFYLHFVEKSSFPNLREIKCNNQSFIN